jgi:hypothetical protein
METFAVTRETTGRGSFTGNHLQQPCDAVLVAHVNPASWQFSQNRYYTQRGKGMRFKRGDEWFGYEQWAAVSGEAGAREERIEYSDPGRTVARYAADLVLAESTEAFLSAARRQSRDHWRDEYTAAAVNRYLREGFGLGGDEGGEAAAKR